LVSALVGGALVPLVGTLQSDLISITMLPNYGVLV